MTQLWKDFYNNKFSASQYSALWLVIALFAFIVEKVLGTSDTAFWACLIISQIHGAKIRNNAN